MILVNSCLSISRDRLKNTLSLGHTAHLLSLHDRKQTQCEISLILNQSIFRYIHNPTLPRQLLVFYDLIKDPNACLIYTYLILYHIIVQFACNISNRFNFVIKTKTMKYNAFSKFSFCKRKASRQQRLGRALRVLLQLICQ